MGEAVAVAVRRVMTAATIVLVENCILMVKLALKLARYRCVGLERIECERSGEERCRTRSVSVGKWSVFIFEDLVPSS